MDINGINSKIAAPAQHIKIDNKMTHVKTSHVKLQQESIMTISSQTGYNSIFNSVGGFIDFKIAAHSNALSQAEKIVLQLDVQVTYPAAGPIPQAYVLPPVYRWIDRIELFSGMQLFDTIRGDHLFYHNTFLHQEELANKGKLELFNPDNYGLATEYPGLYVMETGKNTDTVKNFRCYLHLEDTFITAHGFFLPKISDDIVMRFYFKTFDQIKPTYVGNQPLNMVLSSTQVIISGVKYAPEEEDDLLKNSYNGIFSVKTFIRRWNTSPLTFNNGQAFVDVSYLRGTFSNVGFFILPSNQANGELGIQSVLYQQQGQSNLGVNGIVNNIQPSAYGSSLNYSLSNPINYKFVPYTFNIETFNFLDSSNRPVYVTNQDGNILKNSIPVNNSQVDFQSIYSIYRFDFTDESQHDVENQVSSSGYRFIDGLYQLQLVTPAGVDLNTLSYINNVGTPVPLSPVLIGVGYQLAEVLIQPNGELKIVRH